MEIVVYSDDLLLIEHWENSLQEKFLLVDSLDELYKISDSVIILNHSACNSMCEVVLERLNTKNRVLVLHRTPNIETAKQVLSAGAKGYGNAMMKGHFIISAIETIKENMIWLYPEFTSMLIEDISQKDNSQDLSKLTALSEREKEVAMLLKDGGTYKDIAQKLDITPRTVKAHAANIYTKLSVKDRLGLALLLK